MNIKKQVELVCESSDPNRGYTFKNTEEGVSCLDITLNQSKKVPGSAAKLSQKLKIKAKGYRILDLSRISVLRSASLIIQSPDLERIMLPSGYVNFDDIKMECPTIKDWFFNRSGRTICGDIKFPEGTSFVSVGRLNAKEMDVEHVESLDLGYAASFSGIVNTGNLRKVTKGKSIRLSKPVEFSRSTTIDELTMSLGLIEIT